MHQRAISNTIRKRLSELLESMDASPDLDGRVDCLVNFASEMDILARRIDKEEDDASLSR